MNESFREPQAAGCISPAGENLINNKKEQTGKLLAWIDGTY